MARFSSSPRRTSVAVTVLVALLVVAAGASAALVGGYGFNQGRSKLHAHSFKIAGNATIPARPGMSQELDLRLTNPHAYSLRITRLTVDIEVDPTHAAAGCNRRREFRSVRMPPTSYPIRLRPRRTVSLRQLRVPVLPRIAMLSRGASQDACRGANLRLKYGGIASRWSVGAR